MPAPRHLPNYVEQGIYAALFYRILNVSRKTAAGANIFASAAVYYMFTGYFNPLNGLKAISAYSENNAETKPIPSTTRIAVRFEKQIKYRRLKPVNEYTPPHMPKIMRLTRQIPAESLIPKLCAKTAIL